MEDDFYSEGYCESTSEEETSSDKRGVSGTCAQWNPFILTFTQQMFGPSQKGFFIDL